MLVIVVMMGVSGSGKSTVGLALASVLGVPFLEGDDLHPAANIAKMHAGHALDDADRAPWLDAIADWIAAHAAAGGVVSCSALRRRYRDRLRPAAANGISFVLLDINAATARERVASRQGHFMPPSLIASQLATLERPDGEPDALVLDARQPEQRLLREIICWVDRPAASH